MMLAVATTVTLAAALLPGAFAIPDAHRSAANDATAMHRALQTTVDANGDHHLYFHSIDKLMRTCGHVDAAPFMPAELFEPKLTRHRTEVGEVVLFLYLLRGTNSSEIDPTQGQIEGFV